MGLELPAEARGAIDDHVRLLLAWNPSINLTAIDDPTDVARLHVLDSLSAFKPMRVRRIDAFVDLGSGGGFPGLPLAIALPARRALLLDSIAKKAAFLDAAVAALHVDAVDVAAQRSEALAASPEHREAWPAVLARAVTGLGELVELSFPLLLPGGWLVAWKRGDIGREVDGARRAIDALGGGSIEIVEGAADLPGHLLVFARKAGPTSAGWPRDPAVRRRQPW